MCQVGVTWSSGVLAFHMASWRFSTGKEFRLRERDTGGTSPPKRALVYFGGNLPWLIRRAQSVRVATRRHRTRALSRAPNWSTCDGSDLVHSVFPDDCVAEFAIQVLTISDKIEGTFEGYDQTFRSMIRDRNARDRSSVAAVDIIRTHRRS